MGSIIQKNDNLAKLLDGLSLLNDQDQERIIRMVDILDLVNKKINNEVVSETMYLKNDTKFVYIDNGKYKESKNNLHKDKTTSRPYLLLLVSCSQINKKLWLP